MELLTPNTGKPIFSSEPSIVIRYCSLLENAHTWVENVLIATPFEIV
jgi:hypothetical protein